MNRFLAPDDFLRSHHDPDVFIADCRYDFQNPGIGRTKYDNGHVPGAVYISLDDDLCAPIASHGGRHPIPPIEMMTEKFGSLGIQRGSTRVVAYDDSGGMYAARLVWMLLYLGHDEAFMLDGGYAAYLRAGGEETTDSLFRTPVAFVPKPRPEMLAAMADVKRGGVVLLDARLPERFSGENETVDVKAGHIPGAINQYWMNNLSEDLHLLPVEQLRDRYATLPDNVIMYCGSGVTACVNVLAMEEAGLTRPRLYAGSWSDWITYEDNPVAVGSD